MILINAEEQRLDITVTSPMDAKAKLDAFCGFPWKIVATVNLEEKLYYVIHHIHAHEQLSNITATRMALRIVWGPVAFVEKGVELL